MAGGGRRRGGGASYRIALASVGTRARFKFKVDAKMPQVKCCVEGCGSSSYGKGKDLKFHKISKFGCLSWIRAIKRYDFLDKPPEYLNHKYICSLHFEDCMYASKNLKKNAVPTLNLPIDYDNRLTAPTTAQTGFSIKQYPTTQEDADNHTPNIETATRTSDTKFIMKQNTAKRKPDDDQAINVGMGDIVIKLEPPESFEMTIEQEQIGYHETVKRERFEDPATFSSVEDVANLLVPKVESTNDDPVENNFTTYDKCEAYSVEGLSTFPIKTENIKKEDGNIFVEIDIMTNNTMGMHAPIPSNGNLKKLLRYTKSSSNKNMKKDKKRLINKNKKKDAIKRFLLGCDLYLSPQLSSIVKSQLNSKGDQFTNDYKMFCFHLFLTSPTTYKFLSQILCLPSKNDLTKMYFPIDSKINTKVLDILSEVASKMSPLDKECVLNLGEIKLKRSVYYDEEADRVFGLQEIGGVATATAGRYAYTVMLEGLITDWKLLTGFSFTVVNDLNMGFSTWLLDIIAHLFQLGFKVRAVCCPVLPVFTKIAISVRDNIQEECCFRIGDRKVYFIFDIRSTLKKARNALMRNTLVMNVGKVSWNCVRQLYHVDHIKSKRLVPQLTRSHINLKRHHLKDLCYASKVIDTSVAEALEVYAKKKYLNPCPGTITFIHAISTMFKVLNSDKSVAFSFEEKQLLYKSKELLRTIVMERKTGGVTDKNLCIDALIISINSIFRLSDVLQSENLEVKRQKLTHSWMQSFYNAIRKLSGHSKRVTCREYINAYRRCFIFHALRTAEKKDTTLTNNEIFLAKYESFVRKKKIYETKKPKQPIDVLTKCLLRTPKENRFICVCSYMLQKCVEKHACPKLIEYVNSTPADLNPVNFEIAGLRVPPDHFLIFCTNLENYLKFSVLKSIGNNIFKILLMKMKRLYFDKPCRCFPVEMLLKMFIKMRIKYNILLHNRKWKQEDTSSTFEFNPL